VQPARAGAKRPSESASDIASAEGATAPAAGPPPAEPPPAEPPPAEPPPPAQPPPPPAPPIEPPAGGPPDEPPPAEPPPPPPPPPGEPPRAPGLREQIEATRAAAKALVDAHIELARAEFEDIGGEIKRVAALVGVAIGAGLMAALLLAVGLPLFLGEVIFHSIGWGLLHGVLIGVAVAVAAGITAAGVAPVRIAWAFAAGFFAGLAVSIVLGTNLTNLLWTMAGDGLLPLAKPEDRALASALVILPIALGALIGLLSLISSLTGDDTGVAVEPATPRERLVLGAPTALYGGWLAAFIYSYGQQVGWFDWRLVGSFAVGVIIVEVVAVIVGYWRAGRGLLIGVAIGVTLGLVLGFFTATAFGWRVGIAIGVAVGLVTWIGMMALEASHLEFDEETMKKRFYPQRTIDMTKETIEWARARMPLSRKS
jgi:hypothetical protein